jgi:hypothetical protein
MRGILARPAADLCPCRQSDGDHMAPEVSATRKLEFFGIL